MPPTSSTQYGSAPLNDFIGKVESQIIAPLITLLALIAFVVFIWGVVDYIRGADNDEKRATGQQHILWGFIGLVIIFGTTAIIAVLQSVANIF